MARETQQEKAARIRGMIEAGEIRTWADGFGRWHATVKRSHAFPMGVAKLAIRIELQDRAPRDSVVPMPKLEPVQAPSHVCTKVPPCEPTEVTYRERFDR